MKKVSILNKLRSSGLRPTKQRVEIAKFLFNRDKTFHFTVESLGKYLSKKTTTKFALATIYNTVHAFKKKGYLKEITLNNDSTYFDTNTSHHHHFYDNSTKELIDLNDEDVEKIQINKTLPGKKISSVEILVKVDDE